MISAVISVEDKHFYHHVGIDLLALVTGLTKGLLNGGRFRRGGSTITQQTVKNIVNDWDATFARKFREMVKALQLETLYDKHQILEFYLNQFHVAGNGSGIGIAARYYFNKEAKDLTLVESAFIAGSLKGPSKYNPFIKSSSAARKKPRQMLKIVKTMFCVACLSKIKSIELNMKKQKKWKYLLIKEASKTQK